MRVNNNASFLKNIAVKTHSKVDPKGSCSALGSARGPVRALGVRLHNLGATRSRNLKNKMKNLLVTQV